LVEDFAARAAARKRWITAKIRLSDDHEAFDEAFWADVAPEERIMAAFGLAVVGAQMKGYDGDQLRLCRSVARVERRRRSVPRDRGAGGELP
jgi:hypothetical protein